MIRKNNIHLLILLVAVSSLLVHYPSDVYAADGDVTSTVEINDFTANGPELGDIDYFGGSVANIGDLNGDGVEDIAVGAYKDDEGGDDRGAIHIMFMNTDGSVDSSVEINDSTDNGPVLANNDYWGAKGIANIGDLNNDGVDDLAVGGAGASYRGAMNIMFMNTDGSVDSTVEINESTDNGPTLKNGDQFGGDIANIGDLNGDGVNDLAVGAHQDDMDENGDDSVATNRGAVHIMFMNTDGSVDSTVTIDDSTDNGPTLEDQDRFGKSVENIGDLDGDGINDLAVGTYQADCVDCTGVDSGAVYIMYMGTDGSVKSTVEINDSTANGPAIIAGDHFGASIANIGDLNNDGVNEIVVGARWDDDPNGSFVEHGAIHIMHMNKDGSIDKTVGIARATENGPATLWQDYFGGSVANIGDLDGNGVNDLVVGAHQDGAAVGAVHILFLDK